ncbi:MAG: bifunctional UDP-sugar hydrolase/5'-nucleotidase, partial [Candidatus Poribacteria bacterium]|nr:bifunctional UDP-sugar hydrolase/5'-nucleotidase [Candidatus Poribacteria bacterium]
MAERANPLIDVFTHFLLSNTPYALRFMHYSLCILMGWGLLSLPAFGRAEMTLTILHTNDTYGQLQPVSTGEGKSIGGVLRRAALIRQIGREVTGNLLLDAGDALGPYPLARSDQGETVIDMMNQMGYAGMAIGNHELTDGVEILQQRMKDAQFPMLCANLRLKANGKPLTPRFVVRQVGEIRIGLFGLITPAIQTRILAKHLNTLVIEDAIQTAQDVVAELQHEGCHLIIALTHLGYAADLDLIGRVKGIHLVIGSGVELPEDRTIGALLPVEGAEGTTLVYCPWRGTHLGRVDVCFNRRSDGSLRLQGIDTRKYRLDEATIPEAQARQIIPEMAAQLDDLIQRYQSSQSGVIGRVRPGEQISTLDLVPWILRESTGAEVALLNRGSLTPTVLEGAVQKQQILESIRFSTSVTLLDLTGAQLKAAIISSAKQTSPSRTLLWVGVDATGKTVNGRPIHDKEIYSVVTNDFLAGGGDGYHMLKAAWHSRQTGIPLSQAVIDFLQELAQTEEFLSASRIQAQQPRTVWKSKGQIDVMLQGSTVSDAAKNYPQISELQSENTGTFAIGGVNVHLSTLRAAPRHSLELQVDSEYRRLRHPQTPNLELADSTKAAAIFRYGPPQARLVPLIRLEVEDIEFNPSEDSRVVTLLGSGLESKLSSKIRLSTGLVVRRTFEEESTTEL